MNKLEASAELLRRRRARAGLVEFCRYTRKNYAPGPHHYTLCRELDAVVRGDVLRLIVEMPPRHGKTYHVSEALPARFLGAHRGASVISTSASEPLAIRSGRQVRKIIESPQYQALYPGTGLSREARASGEFLTEAGGFYLATGIHGGFMGSGADLLVIDDPFRSRGEANSLLVRDRVWSACDDLETRLEPGARVVILHTRWHSDDLIGRVLQRSEDRPASQQWRRVALPMIADESPAWERVEAGQGTEHDRALYDRERALWPERWDLAHCREVRRRSPPLTWAALYQQQPSGARGDFFETDKIERFGVSAEPSQGGMPERVRKYLCADFGVRAGGDSTEIYAVGIDPRGHWWVYGGWSARTTADIWGVALVDMIERERPDLVAGEAGVIRRATEPFIKMLLDERRLYTSWAWPTRSGSKQESAVSLQGIVALGRLHVAATNWGDRLVAQLEAFPTAADDHGVDALANLGLAADQSPGAFAAPEVVPSPNPSDRWERARARAAGGNSWKTL